MPQQRPEPEDDNRRLSQVLLNMETEKESMERGRQELTRRSESLQKDLENAHSDTKEVVAQTERLKERESLILQQLKDADERERKHLQLIQDLEKEIRLSTNERSPADLVSAGTTAFVNGVVMSEQVGSRLGSTEPPPSLHQHELVPTSPDATDVAWEARQLGEANGTRSTENLSPPSSPPRNHIITSPEPLEQSSQVNNLSQDDIPPVGGGDKQQRADSDIRTCTRQTPRDQGRRRL